MLNAPMTPMPCSRARARPASASRAARRRDCRARARRGRRRRAFRAPPLRSRSLRRWRRRFGLGAAESAASALARRSRSGRPFVSIQPMATRLPSAAGAARLRAAGASCRRPERWRRRRRAARDRRVRAGALRLSPCDPSRGAFAAAARRAPPGSCRAGENAATWPWRLCYALARCARGSSIFFTPQLFIAAILLNGPIALSSLALRTSPHDEPRHRGGDRERHCRIRERRAGAAIIGTASRSAIDCSRRRSYSSAT